MALHRATNSKETYAFDTIITNRFTSQITPLVACCRLDTCTARYVFIVRGGNVELAFHKCSVVRVNVRFRSNGLDWIGRHFVNNHAYGMVALSSTLTDFLVVSQFTVPKVCGQFTHI